VTEAEERTAAEKLAVVENELARVRAEYETFKRAISDPALRAWIDSGDRVAPRAITTMEHATLKHLYSLTPQLRALEAAEAFLIVRTLDETAGKPSDGGLEDPEALLRAALVCLAHAWKSGHRSVEHRVTLQAIARYLQSLDEDV